MRVGFVGLGNVGAKLASTLARNGVELVVRDIDPAATEPLVAAGARALDSPALVASASDVVITCLPNPVASAGVLEADDGLLTGLRPGGIWVEMSTTDLVSAYEAVRISSGNSFVHETESQVILNGSRDSNFTMDLVAKDIGLFQAMADHHDVELELSPLLVDVFDDAIARYGDREWSLNVIRRLEDRTGIDVRAPGFPASIVDDEPEQRGVEVMVDRGDRRADGDIHD